MYMKEIDVSRRGFLKGGAVAAAVAGITMAGVSGCSSKPASSGSASASGSAAASAVTYKPETTKDFDVVVIGAGASGISCAVRCAEKGLKAALLEKTTNIGGASNSVFSAMVRTPEEVGSEVDAWVADCHWRVDATAIGNILGHSEEAFNWLRDNWGWGFTPINSMGVANWKIDVPYKDRPAQYQNMIDKSGVTLESGMTAKQLVQGSDGSVTGVIAIDGSNKATQYNAKAVVIATGGYAGNSEMVGAAFGRTPLCGGLPQNIGEGLEMAWAAGGAKPQNYGMQMPHQTYTEATEKLASTQSDFESKYPMLCAYAPSFLNVSVLGKRFRNEGILYNADAAANSTMFQGDYHWTIVSADQLKKLEEGGLAAMGVDKKLTIPPSMLPKLDSGEFDLNTPWPDATKIFDKMCEVGGGFKGNTPEDLAKAASMDPASFKQAFEDYENICKAAFDSQCGKDPMYLIPMGSGPYYAIDTRVNNLSSVGGVAVDTSFRVLNDKGAFIPGLYAIGVECMSNLYNDTYTGVGAALCTVYTTGYLTAEGIAANK